MHLRSIVLSGLARPLLGAALCAAAFGAAAAGPAAPGQIYQQRAADGRIVLTDRPSATAVTERTWQLDREDPALASQRALDVRREANLVSERIQRRIEAQERNALAYDIERMRLAQRERELQLARADADYDSGSVVIAPVGNRRFTGRRGSGIEHRPPPPRRPVHAPARMLPVS